MTLQVQMDPVDVARLELSVRDLGDKVTRAVLGHKMTKSRLHEIEYMVKDHVKAARRVGIRLPELTVVAVKASRAAGDWHVQVLRQDLEFHEIQNLILGFVQKDGVTPTDIAQSINRAFPQYQQTLFDYEGRRRAS